MSSSTLALTGSCGCGAVRFTVAQPPDAAAYCHCTRCQKRSGTAVQASARVPAGSVTVTDGESLLGAWSPPGGLAKEFCRECGSHLFARDPESGERVVVRMSAFDADPGVRPTAHQYVAYAAPWEPVPDDGLPRFDERIPAD